jgi:hypothetical protein
VDHKLGLGQQADGHGRATAHGAAPIHRAVIVLVRTMVVMDVAGRGAMARRDVQPQACRYLCRLGLPHAVVAGQGLAAGHKADQRQQPECRKQPQGAHWVAPMPNVKTMGGSHGKIKTPRAAHGYRLVRFGRLQSCAAAATHVRCLQTPGVR